ERTLTSDAGLPASSARHYDKAHAIASIGGERFEYSLATDRKLIIARRGTSGLFCYALTGPLTRDELDLVTEHFNPQCLPGLLPGKAVNVGDTWPLSPVAVQAACLFDGVIKHALTGKLAEVRDGLAAFTVEATGEGIEQGAKVTLTVSATGKYDPNSRRVVELTWKQKDDRD